MPLRVMRLISAAGVLAAIVACGGSSDNNSTGPTPVFTSVSLGPQSPTLAVGATVTMVATPKDQTGASMSGLPAATFSSSDPTTVTVDPATGLATGVAVGGATITATIVSGSVSLSGTQQVTVTAPSSTASVTATTGQAFVPNAVTITVGSGSGTVTWVFQSLAHTVSFDQGPAGSTNPPDIGVTTNASVPRTFTTHGVYHYHCTIHSNMSGTVTVN
jgi:plastocyanin